MSDLLVTKITGTSAAASTFFGADGFFIHYLPDVISLVGSLVGLTLSFILIRYWLKRIKYLEMQMKKTQAEIDNAKHKKFQHNKN